MNGTMVGAALLVAGPAAFVVLGLYPPMFRVWTVPRDEHLALVHAHGRAWTLINAGFVIATIGTAAGLGVLAADHGGDGGWGAVLVAGAIVYAIAGALWCAVVGIRTRTTPVVAAMVAAGTPTEPAEAVLSAATGGLFVTFLLATGAALVAVGLALAIGGGVAAPVAWLAALVGAAAIAGYLAFGDMPPFVLYIPTFLIGLTLLAGLS
ncbi:MAG TPA: hypothetical protein VLM76_14645 [Patescibacteria group bacterium]|nr:hypothetical protein [Patescibacteria group bacterium]